MPKHAFRLAIENRAPVEDFQKLFAPDAVLHAPMLSKPVRGREQVIRLISTAATIPGPLNYTRELSDGVQTFLFWSGRVHTFELQALTIVVDGDDELIHEVRVLMRTWPIVTLFRDAMKDALGNAIPDGDWELGPRTASSGQGRRFTPISLSKINLAPEIELHSPMLAKAVKGVDLVQRSLKMAHSVQSPSSYTSIVARPDLLIELFDCDADGYPMEGMWVSRLNSSGQIDDLTVYLRPYPAVTVLRNKAKVLAASDPEFAFLDEEYWDLPAHAEAK